MDNAIILSGTPGCGKTAALKAISDTLSPAAEAWSCETPTHRGRSRAVRLEHGLIDVGSGESLHLYRMPWIGGHDSMWIRLAEEMATGFIILLDARRPDPLSDLCAYLRRWGRAIAATGNTAVAAITHGDVCPRPDLRQRVLEGLESAASGKRIPVFEIDGRSRPDVKQLLLAVIAMAGEAGMGPAARRADA